LNEYMETMNKGSEQIHLPQTIEELHKQIDWYSLDAFKLDRLRELAREYEERIPDWEGYQLLLEEAKRMEADYSASMPPLPFPVVCSVEEYSTIQAKGDQISKEWIQWILSNLVEGSQPDQLAYSRAIIRKACQALEKQGKDSSELEWTMMNIPYSFKDYLKEQLELLPESEDCFETVHKIKTDWELDKLERLFADLIQQKVVQKSAYSLIRHRFTRDDQQKVPPNTPLIDWIPSKRGRPNGKRNRSENRLTAGGAALRAFIKAMNIEDQDPMKHFTINGELKESDLKGGGSDDDHHVAMKRLINKHR
jgi:hypothetical protein